MTEQAEPSIEQLVTEYETTKQPEAAPASTPTHDPIEPPKDPIDEASVQSDKAPDESLPDSSLIAKRLQSLRERTEEYQNLQRSAQEHEQLRREVELLRTLRGTRFDEQLGETQELADSRSDDQSKVMKELRAELDQLKQERENFKKEREEEVRMRELYQAQADTVQWVKDQSQHFPLINDLGQQALVFQKIMNEHQRTGRYISEAQAASEVENEVRAIVERLAPKLGYTKGDREPRRDEQVSVGAGSMGISEPLDIDKMDDHSALDALVALYENNQR